MENHKRAITERREGDALAHRSAAARRHGDPENFTVSCNHPISVSFLKHGEIDNLEKN